MSPAFARFGLISSQTDVESLILRGSKRGLTGEPQLIEALRHRDQEMVRIARRAAHLRRHSSPLHTPQLCASQSKASPARARSLQTLLPD